ncbi:MAG: DUF1684 domain-containing protein [Acidobacteriota bacterium]
MSEATLIRPALALAAVVLASAACKAPLPPSEESWRQERERGVIEMVAVETKVALAGLRFYPFDPAYRFKAMVEPIVPPEPLRLGASDGSIRPAHRVGRVRLRMPGGEARLSLFQLDDIRDQYPDMLFLPFRDAGAGAETYGAGRYVDVERLAGGVVAIDFNRATNPDCAYGVSAQCPITPAENTLPFKVEAGEMLPPGH